MWRFVAGLIAGVLLGSMASAYAAHIRGDGSLTGWTVTKGGDTVCSDPDVDRISKEIQCD